MRSTSSILLATLFIVCSLSAAGQTAPADAKQFARDGLTFSYPANWAFTDESNSNSVELNFINTDIDCQLKVSVFRTPLTTPEKLAEAKRILVDRYIATIVKSFADANGRPESSETTSEIATLKSEGTMIKATLFGAPGSAEVEWAVVGTRMVVLTLLGPNTEVKKAKPVWDMIRTSMKVEPPQQPVVPPKKP